MIKLILRLAPQSTELAFEKDVVTLGRHSTNDVVVRVRKASRHHAKIEKVEGEYRIVDLESNNGTRLNGTSIVSQALKRGDEIGIAEATVTIMELDMPPALPAAPAPLEEELPAPPVPLEQKVELKRKIEDAKSALAQQRRGAPPKRSRSMVGVGIAAGVFGLGAIVFLAVSYSSSREAAREREGQDQAAAYLKEVERDLEGGALDLAKLRRYARSHGKYLPAREGKDPFTHLLHQAEEAQRRLAKARMDAFNGTADLAELRRDAERYGRYLKASGATDPFTAIAERVEKEQPDQIPEKEFAARVAHVEESLKKLMRDHEYGKAVRLLTGLIARADTSQKNRLAGLLYKTNNRIWQDFQAALRDGGRLESQEAFELAKEHYRSMAPKFQGTEYFALLSSRPADIDLLVRTRKVGLLAKKNQPKKEIARKEVDEEKEVKETPPSDEKTLERYAAFLRGKLAAAIQAGRFTAKVRLAAAVIGLPKAADTEGIQLTDQGKVKWADIEDRHLFRLYAQSGLEGDELLSLAEWAHARELPDEANKTLFRFIAGKKENRAKVDAVLARWRGTAVPEGGYKYNTRTRRWEDRAEIATREVLEGAGRVAKSLAKESRVKRMAPLHAKLLEYYHDTKLSWPVRDKVKAMALAALGENKKKRLDSITKKAKRKKSFALLRKAKTELNLRREAAIKLIYDPKIYVPEDHPDWRKGDKANGQTQVDELVGKVRELWDQAGRFVAKLDPSVRRDLEAISHINQRMLSDFGEEAPADELKDFEEVLNNLTQRIDLRSFALDAKERQIYEWNRRVEKYNASLQDKDIAKEEKEHFKVLNDYREMMGRRRLFLDARLCRATKKHSAVCDRAGTIWHVGSDGSPQSRAQAEGFTAGVGENVAIGYASPADIWTRGWYRASDHHRNGLSAGWNCGGYGYSGRVGTENFSNIAPPRDFPK